MESASQNRSEFDAKRKEKMLWLSKELAAVESDRLNGSKGYSIDEVANMIALAINVPHPCPLPVHN